MVAQLGHLLVGDRVEIAQRGLAALLGDLLLRDALGRLREQPLEGEGGVVRAEHLGSQPVHDAAEVLVEVTRLDLLEEIVLFALLLEELADELVRLRDDGHRVVELDRVLAEEVELELVVAVQLHVLDAEGAAADRVRLLVGVLLVAHAERQLVDQVDGDRALLHLALAVPHPHHVVLAYALNVVLELARLVVLGHVGHALPRRVGGEPHALVLPAHVVLPLGEPRHLRVVHDLPPPVHLPVLHVGHGRHGRPLGHVDRDVLRHHSPLHAAALWVVAAPAEEAGRLDAEVAHLFPAPVDGGVQKVGLLLVLRLLVRELLFL
mmetsp:Transcript_9961/g.25794  ORF Transcript_9961/g.25794 Transcript_9961/m.25794 type:complete len:321 (-) Transcript_9961:282-1244(-)